MWIYKIEWYIRALRWLYENRTWENTRQKWKAFDRYMGDMSRFRG